jgi:hypothetical protein
MHGKAPPSANLEIKDVKGVAEPIGSPPVFEMIGFRPCSVDQLSRKVEHAGCYNFAFRWCVEYS